jgi:L-arabinose isomerase
MNHNYYHLRVGLIGLGLEEYWAQFAGLRNRLEAYLGRMEEKIASDERRIFNFGLVDTPYKAIETGHACRQNDCDILVVYVATYALSNSLLPVIQHAKVPVLLLNVQPELALDYKSLNAMTDRTAMTGEWLAYCSSCPVPEFANVLRRLDIPFRQVTGVLENDPACWSEVEGWLCAARVVKALAHSRLALMGHYYGGMLDIATDLALISGKFGIHIEQLEVDELSGMRRSISDVAISAKVAEFNAFFDIEADCISTELERAARTAVALDEFVALHQLDMLAYYYKGTGTPENEDTMSSVILGTSMLTGNGVPVAGEYEIKNAIAMKVMDEFGMGGSFTEYYAVDFKEDLILMGHDGPGHIGIAQHKIKVRPLRVYHGKVGSGLSVEMSVKHGPVTLLSVAEDKQSGFMLLIAQGECVPGEILEIGNTNSRYRFSLGARSFIETWNSYGPAHHCAIGVGHFAAQLHKVASLLKLNSVQVC